MMIKVMQLFELIKSYLMERWHKLSGSEKKIAAFLIIVCAVSFIYLTIVSPLFSWNREIKRTTELNYNDFTFVQQNVSRAQQTSDTVLKNNKNPNYLATSISSTGKKAGIIFSRVHPVKQDVTLWINEVSYQQFINWTLQLHKQAQINVKQTKIEKTNTEGMVKVFLRLGY